MPFKDGDFVRINYVGRIKETGEIFDLTLEDVAKKNGLYTPEFKYRPVPVIIGAKFVLPALEEEIKKMKIGEKKKIVLPPEKAFGVRSPSYIKLIPVSQFKKQGLEPYPGMEVTINNLRGRVLSVAGGRVKVDFNHPLAGKEIEYEVEVVEKINERAEQVKAIVDYFLALEPKDVDVAIDKKTASITFKKHLDVTSRTKEKISETIKKWVKLEKVRFIDEF